MKILLVDDSKTMRNIWCKSPTSKMEDVETVEAGNGLEAVSAIEAATEAPFAHNGQLFNLTLIVSPSLDMGFVGTEPVRYPIRPC